MQLSVLEVLQIALFQKKIQTSSISLQEFMTEKSSVHESVKYILHTIERMEEQFYINSAQSFTIQQVKEKFKLLK